MRNIAQWNRWFADNADLITPVRTTADIRRAKAEEKTGIILGFQNTSAFEDQIGYISLFKGLGVGVAQITYNTQNLSGAGCYQPRDPGLSGFGMGENWLRLLGGVLGRINADVAARPLRTPALHGSVLHLPAHRATVRA